MSHPINLTNGVDVSLEKKPNGVDVANVPQRLLGPTAPLLQSKPRQSKMGRCSADLPRRIVKNGANTRWGSPFLSPVLYFPSIDRWCPSSLTAAPLPRPQPCAPSRRSASPPSTIPSSSRLSHRLASCVLSPPSADRGATSVLPVNVRTTACASSSGK